MSSRETILSNVRKRLPPACELPSLEQAWIQYADPAAQFISALELVGGRGVLVEGFAELNAHLKELPAFAQAKKVCTTLAGIEGGNVDLAALPDPHAVEDIDFAVLPGEFGVAENAAVWVTERSVKHRVVYFLVQHLALVIPAASIVHNMHEAYKRLAFDQAGFGVFISGPSKTADIEQSLVIGAHGPRSMTVFLTRA